jgi:hypothetical protein
MVEGRSATPRAVICDPSCRKFYALWPMVFPRVTRRVDAMSSPIATADDSNLRPARRLFTIPLSARGFGGKHMTNRARSTTMKFLAAGGLAVGLGLLAGVGTAAADGHNIVDEDGTWGAPDGAEQRGMSRVPAVHSIDTSANVAPSWPATPSWPAPPSWGSYPAGSSYPATSSWPGSGWGAGDN